MFNRTGLSELILIFYYPKTFRRSSRPLPLFPNLYCTTNTLFTKQLLIWVQILFPNTTYEDPLIEWYINLVLVGQWLNSRTEYDCCGVKGTRFVPSWLDFIGSDWDRCRWGPGTGRQKDPEPALYDHVLGRRRTLTGTERETWDPPDKRRSLSLFVRKINTLRDPLWYIFISQFFW